MRQAASTGPILSLFEQHYEELYCHLRRFTTPRETEQVCRQAFQELVSGETVGPVTPDRETLFRVAERVLRDRYRPLRRIAAALDQQNLDGEWNTGKENKKKSGSPVATRVLRKMEREMRQLPGDLRQALDLLIGQKMPLKEASIQMGVSEELLDKWATHGLRRLTQRMYSICSTTTTDS